MISQYLGKGWPRRHTLVALPKQAGARPGWDTKSCDFKVLLRVDRNKCGLVKRPWGHLTVVLIVVAKLSVPISSLTRS